METSRTILDQNWHPNSSFTSSHLRQQLTVLNNSNNKGQTQHLDNHKIRDGTYSVFKSVFFNVHVFPYSSFIPSPLPSFLLLHIHHFPFTLSPHCWLPICHLHHSIFCCYCTTLPRHVVVVLPRQHHQCSATWKEKRKRTVEGDM